MAKTASCVLVRLGETQMPPGDPMAQSAIEEPRAATHAVSARMNAHAPTHARVGGGAGDKPCIIGGTAELTGLLSDVYELKNDKPASSPEFFGFASWREVVEFADSEEGESIKSFVQLVEQHGENKLWPAVKGTH